jgi:branched-chain amino acid transport system substrate-binding protein
MRPLAIALCAAPAQAQQPSSKNPLNVKIGVLSDMSGLYADIGGPGSVVAAQMVVEDFNPGSHRVKVEIISADHQNKPDIGSTIARRWFDTEHVSDRRRAQLRRRAGS